MIYKKTISLETDLYDIFTLSDDNYDEWTKDFEDFINANIPNFSDIFTIDGPFVKLSYSYFNVEEGEVWFDITVSTDNSDFNGEVLSDDEFFKFCDKYRETHKHGVEASIMPYFIDTVTKFNNLLREANIKVPNCYDNSTELVYRDRQYYIAINNISLNSLNPVIEIQPKIIHVKIESIPDEDMFA